MSDELIKRLRDTPNWLKESFGHWKDCTTKYDRAPFEAADRIAELEAKVRELEAELETERMRLAGCGVAALGYFDGCKDEYKSASLGDVLQLHDQLTASRQQVERLKELWFSDADPLETEFRDEAIAAVEKERT